MTFGRPGRRKELGYDRIRHFILSPIIHIDYSPIFCHKTSIVFSLFWDNSITHVREIFVTFFLGGGGGEGTKKVYCGRCENGECTYLC